MSAETSLRRVRCAHTVIWAFFAGCVLAIPVFTYFGQLGISALLIGIVGIEVVVLLLNGWRCPLTGVAARFTDDRAPNFDIHLPVFLAKHNKTIFGALFVAGCVYTLAMWFATRSVP